MLFGHPGPGAVARRRRRAAARRVRRVPAGAAVRRRRRCPGIAAAAAYAANPIARNAIWQGELGPLVLLRARAVRPRRVRAGDERHDAPRRGGRGRRAAPRAGARSTCCARSRCSSRSRVRCGRPRCCSRPRSRSRICIALPVRRAAPAGPGSPLGGALVASGRRRAAARAVVVLVARRRRGDASARNRGRRCRSRRSCTSTPGGPGAGSRRGASSRPRSCRSRSRPGRGSRWATRAWVLAAISFALAWLPGRVSAGRDGRSRPTACSSAAAIGLAFAAGLGVAAVLDDLRRFHFGWRQVMMIVAFAGLALVGARPRRRHPVGPLRAARPTTGRGTYSWMNDNAPAGGFRVLWVGDPNVLPADAKVAGDVGFALDPHRPRRRARRRGPRPNSTPTGCSPGMIDAGVVGFDGAARAPARAGRRALRRVRRRGPRRRAARVGRDETRDRRRARAPARPDAVARRRRRCRVRERRVDARCARVVPPGDTARAGRRARPAGGRGAVGARRRDRRAARAGRTSAVGPGTLLWSEAASAHWAATADGGRSPRRDAFGWTNAFALDAHAPVHVHYSGSSLPTLARVVEVVLWIARRRGVVRDARGGRRRGRRSRGRPAARIAGSPADRLAGGRMKSRRFLFVVVVGACSSPARSRPGTRRTRPPSAGAPVPRPAPSAAVVGHVDTVWFCPGLPPRRCRRRPAA